VPSGPRLLHLRALGEIGTCILLITTVKIMIFMQEDGTSESATGRNDRVTLTPGDYSGIMAGAA
jgi:hypothetical protein